ncbi:unnamed protein product [Bubo scandiacus]
MGTSWDRWGCVGTYGAGQGRTGTYGAIWAPTRKPPNVTVTLIPPSANGGAEGAGLLLCDVTAFAPRDIVVRWEGPGDAPARARLGPVTGDALFAVLSLLRLAEGEGGSGLRLRGSPRPPPSLHPPSFHELVVHQEANLTCTSPLANATVGWEVGGQAAEAEAVTTRHDGATGTRSWLRVSLRDWNETTKFSCWVRGGDGQETQLEINRRTGPPKPPSVRLVPDSPTGAFAGHDFTLLCLVRDFYPPEIAVWWRRGANEEPVDEAASCDHRARRCSLVATVAVPWAQWAAGTAYGCLATHVPTGERAEATVDVHADPWGGAGLHLVPCGYYGDGDDLEEEEDGGAWTTISTFVVLFLLLIFYSGFVTFIKPPGRG